MRYEKKLGRPTYLSVVLNLDISDWPWLRAAPNRIRGVSNWIRGAPNWPKGPPNGLKGTPNCIKGPPRESGESSLELWNFYTVRICTGLKAKSYQYSSTWLPYKSGCLHTIPSCPYKILPIWLLPSENSSYLFSKASTGPLESSDENLLDAGSKNEDDERAYWLSHGTPLSINNFTKL